MRDERSNESSSQNSAAPEDRSPEHRGSDARTPGPDTPDPAGPEKSEGRRKLRLDQFLKFTGLASTGGQAKHRIQSGEVRVNGETETRRGRGLKPGDEVEIDGRVHQVHAEMWEPDPPGPLP